MGFILFIHISACVLLIITVLMQAGRGGGLAESFSSAESMFGTQTNKFMVRVSSVLAAIFLCTSLVLAVDSSKGQKSLMKKSKVSQAAKEAVAKAQEEKKAEPTVKVSEPQAVTQEKVVETATKTVNEAAKEMPVQQVNAAK